MPAAKQPPAFPKASSGTAAHPRHRADFQQYAGSQDIAATVLHAFGLDGEHDSFIPGGSGHFEGVVG